MGSADFACASLGKVKTAPDAASNADGGLERLSCSSRIACILPLLVGICEGILARLRFSFKAKLQKADSPPEIMWLEGALMNSCISRGPCLNYPICDSIAIMLQDCVFGQLFSKAVGMQPSLSDMHGPDLASRWSLALESS